MLRRLVPLLATAAALAVPAVAQAATTGTMVSGTLYIHTDAGAQNQIRVASDPTSSTAVAVTDGGAEVNTAGGCNDFGTTIFCFNVQRVEIHAGAGNDTVTVEDPDGFGAARSAKVFGGDGNDTITTAEGIDDIHGEGDDDTITTGPGTDVLNGEAGNDTLSGGSQRDQLAGEAGDDTLEGGTGPDVLTGGEGVDRAVYGGRTSAVTALLTPGTDNGELAEHDEVGGDLENLSGGDAGDTLTGDERANDIRGGEGTDTIVAAAGNDHLQGDGGADDLNGGAGIDTFSAGAGDDKIDSRDGIAESVECGAGTDTVLLDAADSQDGCENVSTGAVTDNRTPPSNNNGQPGNDTKVVVPAADKTAPKLAVSVAKKQRRALVFRFTCSEDCSVRASAALSLRGLAKKQQPKAMVRNGVAGKPVTVTIKLSKAALKALKRAKRGAKVKLTLVASDAASNAASPLVRAATVKR